MIYGFDCDDRDEATAALIVYAIWRSRDRARYRVTPDVWGQVERFTKASAKRSTTIPVFIEALKPRLLCATIHPRAMEVGIKGRVPLIETGAGELIARAPGPEQREFLTQVRARCDERRVLDILYRETSWVILLVRDRLERERPVEREIEAGFVEAESEVVA